MKALASLVMPGESIPQGMRRSVFKPRYDQRLRDRLDTLQPLVGAVEERTGLKAKWNGLCEWWEFREPEASPRSPPDAVLTISAVEDYADAATLTTLIHARRGFA